MYRREHDFEELKKILRGILVSAPSKLGVQDLLHDYRKLEGKDLLFRKYGYASFVDLLVSITDVCMLEYENDHPKYVLPVVTEKLSYIYDLVSKQKPPDNKPKQKTRCGIHIPKIIPSNLQYFVLHFVENHPKGVKLEVLKQEICSKFPLQYIGINNIEDLVEEMSHSVRFVDGKVFPILNKSEGKNCNGQELNEGDALYKSSQMLPGEIVENIQKLLQENPNGILMSELLGKYKETYGCPLQYRIYGYADIFSIMSAYPNIGHIYRVSECDFMIKEIPDELDAAKVNNGEGTENYFKVQALKDNLIWLLSNYPAGLLIEHLHETYKIYFPQGFCEIELGFPDLKSMLFYFQKQSILEISNDNEGCKLFPSNSHIPMLQFNSDTDGEIFGSEEDELNETSSSSNQSASNNDFNYINHHPDNTVGPEAKIPLQDVTGLDFEALEVTVSHVKSPSKFWFILNYDDNCYAFDTLVELMQDFYETNSDKYKLSQYAINEGQYCVCQLHGAWHRAKITKIVSSTEVEVYYIDIGTTVIVENSSLRYLLKMFSSLSAQALEAKLAHLVPLDSNLWEQEVCDYFSEIVCGTSFIGVIKDTQSTVLRCDLLYFANDEWCSVSDRLVAEEMAEYLKQTPTAYGNKLSIEQQLGKFIYH